MSTSPIGQPRERYTLRDRSTGRIMGTVEFTYGEPDSVPMPVPRHDVERGAEPAEIAPEGWVV